MSHPITISFTMEYVSYHEHMHLCRSMLLRVEENHDSDFDSNSDEESEDKMTKAGVKGVLNVCKEGRRYVQQLAKGIPHLQAMPNTNWTNMEMIFDGSALHDYMSSRTLSTQETKNRHEPGFFEYKYPTFMEGMNNQELLEKVSSEMGYYGYRTRGNIKNPLEITLLSHVFPTIHIHFYSTLSITTHEELPQTYILDMDGVHCLDSKNNRNDLIVRLCSELHFRKIEGMAKLVGVPFEIASTIRQNLVMNALENITLVELDLIRLGMFSRPPDVDLYLAMHRLNFSFTQPLRSLWNFDVATRFRFNSLSRSKIIKWDKGRAIDENGNHWYLCCCNDCLGKNQVWKHLYAFKRARFCIMMQTGPFLSMLDFSYLYYHMSMRPIIRRLYKRETPSMMVNSVTPSRKFNEVNVVSTNNEEEYLNYGERMNIMRTININTKQGLMLSVDFHDQSSKGEVTVVNDRLSDLRPINPILDRYIVMPILNPRSIDHIAQVLLGDDAVRIVKEKRLKEMTCHYCLTWPALEDTRHTCLNCVPNNRLDYVPLWPMANRPAVLNYFYSSYAPVSS